MAVPDSIRCIFVDKVNDVPQPSVQNIAASRFPQGEVTIRIAYSSLNYKDVLACQGHRGVIRSLPHVPGIDLAGTVVASSDPEYAEGDQVLVTGYELGQSHWGGWAEFAQVPASWVIKLPDSLSLFESMFIGTAGFTAAQCLQALQRNGTVPSSGPVVVTGATGAVGSLAVRLLAQNGYQTVAVTGKPEQADALRAIGASQVISREEVTAGDASRPLQSAKWAGAIDTVGGTILSSLVKSTRYGGCVAACGLVAGVQLEMSVYPFLLRGVNLCGAASADCPSDIRVDLWKRLASDWKPGKLDVLVREVGLEELLDYVPRMANGQVAGRIVVNCQK
ncbi:MAG: oxidoreductase [Pirellulaceae bacterium]|nr:oxidoreductase [Pirellulaceae bacterium]